MLKLNREKRESLRKDVDCHPECYYSHNHYLIHFIPRLIDDIEELEKTITQMKRDKT